MRHVSIAAVFVSLLTASAVHAVPIPLFTFENDEFAGDGESINPLGAANSSAGLGGGFGVTEGTQALVVNNAPAVQNPVWQTTVSGSDTAESLSNYQAFRSAITALESGQNVTFNFDYSYDFTNTTTGGFFQPGLIFNNSGGGYQSNLAYGGLAGGNVRSFADFPAIGPAAQAGGGTLTILDPIDYVSDFVGSLRMSIPVGLPGSGKPIIIGVDAANADNSYFQFAVNTNGGFGGTANYAFDNIHFNAAATAQPGDFNQDTLLNAIDVELLLDQPNGPVAGTSIYDVNADNQLVTAPGAAGSDTDFWVTQLAQTRYGDTNFDKDVDFDDLVVLAQNYGSNTATWSTGSFDGDGTVDFDDLVLVAQNYGFLGAGALAQLSAINSHFGTDWVLAQSLLPEPTALVALGAVSLFLRRPRRR